MNVEVINTGTELLLGNVVNLHLATFGQVLFPLGLRISRQVTVPDGAAIRDALIEAFDRADIVLVTGGLGPTTDDITREVTAELLGLRLVEDETILNGILALCDRRGFAFQPRMGRQAMVPEGATVLQNLHGTAPGLYFPPVEFPSTRTPHVFLLPGPPRELKPMFENEALPILREIVGGLSDVICRSYRCVGIGESLVETRIGLRLSSIAGLEIGYCARSNEVDLRLIGPRALVESLDAEVLAELGTFVASVEGSQLEDVVVTALRTLGRSVATAESCTGGLVAHRLTNVAGASEVFQRGWVTYANAAKIELLGVDAAALATHGAVSELVAGQMAAGARERANADFGLATTGIAGPGGGSDSKPVGTVWLAVAERGRETDVWKEFFPTDRETFKHLASQALLNRLRLRMLA